MNIIPTIITTRIIAKNPATANPIQDRNVHVSPFMISSALKQRKPISPIPRITLQSNRMFLIFLSLFFIGRGLFSINSLGK